MARSETINRTNSTRRSVIMADKVKDPVCGMEIRPEDAAATEDHEGRRFYFCSHACHQTFVKDPHRYGHPAVEHGGHAHH
jgi:YHS domain-containing protein